jgi:hypothetical protein
MLGLIFFVSILLIFGLFCLAGWIRQREHYIKKGWSVDKSIFSGIGIAGLCLIGIIALLSYWFSGATPRDYTSQKYQELDKKYHLEMLQPALKNDRKKILLKDVNKVIYTDYVERWHLFLGLVSFNVVDNPCRRIITDANNYSTTIQDEILKVYYDNNFLRYLTFIIFGIMSWSVIEYTCAYDVSSDVLID